jgi:hypothetical protein
MAHFGAQVLWAALDGSRYVWIPISTQGEPPSPRFHHTCDSYDGAPQYFPFHESPCPHTQLHHCA